MTNIHTQDRTMIEQIRDILAAGYPSLVYHEPKGTATIGEIDWWHETERESELIERYADLYGDGDKYFLALDELCNYGREIADNTLAVIAKRRNLGELLHLLDAAAQNGGSAVFPDSSSGQFLRRIAELALTGLAAEAK